MLKTRVLTAVALLAVLLSALFLLPRSGWILFSALFLGVAAWEWGGLASLPVAARSVYAAFMVGIFVSLGILASVWAERLYAPIWVYHVGAFFWVILAPLWIWWRPPPARGRVELLGAGALALLPAAAALVDLRSVAPSLLLAVLATVWISDTVAYFVGVRFGKHKLAPTISPGKSWEGVAGALAAVALYALAWASLGNPPERTSWPGGAQGWMLPVLLGLAVVGMIGDLFESLIKRQAGVKDSGTFLPGHGGLLDRIDAPVAMLPLAVLAFVR